MFYLGRYGSVASRSEYGRIIAEWQAGPPETPPASPTMPSVLADLTVAELFRAYFRHCQQYYVKNGEVTNQVTMIHLALQVARTPLRPHSLSGLRSPGAEGMPGRVHADRGFPAANATAGRT